MNPTLGTQQPMIFIGTMYASHIAWRINQICASANKRSARRSDYDSGTWLTQIVWRSEYKSRARP